jgi:hypothetical protein
MYPMASILLGRAVVQIDMRVSIAPEFYAVRSTLQSRTVAHAASNVVLESEACQLAPVHLHHSTTRVTQAPYLPVEMYVVLTTQTELLSCRFTYVTKVDRILDDSTGQREIYT